MLIVAGVFATIGCACWITTLSIVGTLISEEFIEEINFDKSRMPRSSGQVIYSRRIFS
jgi:hypothetical protein